MTSMPMIAAPMPTMAVPMGPMGPMAPMVQPMVQQPMMAPNMGCFHPSGATLLVPVTMVVVGPVPSPCSTPTSIPSVASSEMVSEGSLSRQSTGASSSTTVSNASGGDDAFNTEMVDAQSLTGCVWDLSQRTKGCRVVQQALDACSDVERATLAQELKGHILAAARSACGNYVLQKFIQVLRPQTCQFIIDELMQEPQEVCDLARHQYGCRILQRLFENCQSEQMEQLVMMLLSEASALVRHSYGTYVMQQIFDFGNDMQCRLLGETLLAAGSQVCNDEHATQVYQKALQHAPQKVKLAEALVHQLPQMARGRHSHQTVLAALHLLPQQESERAIALLSAKVKKLWASRYGRLVVKSVPQLYQQCSSLTRREAASA